MPKSFQTSGLQGVDREFDLLWQQVANLKNSSAPPAASVPAVQTITQVSQAVLTVQNTSGSVSVAAQSVVVDDAAGLSVAATGQANQVKVSRTAASTVPGAIASSGSAGSSVVAANADHTHAGVASVAVAGALISESGSTGAVTLTVRVLILTSDPGSLAAGDLWFRSDTGMLSLYTGSATKRVAMI